ncbi:MAG: hypothetical protein GY757_17865, partial [bacterium]|nr:hypothetical protein [bacterium]
KAYSLWKEFAEYPGGKELHGVYYHRALASYLPGTVAIVYEELFLEFIRRHNIKYIVTLDRLPGFHKVLDRHPAFRRVGAPVKTGSGSWSFTFRIYTFDPSRGQTGLSDTPPVISSSLAKTLESLQKNDPARLQQLLNNMSSSAGLSDQNKLKKELGLKPDKKK